MNKQFLISVVVFFFVSMTTDFVLHGLVLANDYAAQPALSRAPDDAMRHFPVMLLAHVFLAIGITAIYRRGREASRDWMGQGVRFGLWFAIASCVPTFMIYYAVQPMGLMLAFKQIVFGGVQTVLLGIVVAALNKQA